MTLHDQYFRNKFWEMEWKEEFIEGCSSEEKKKSEILEHKEERTRHVWGI